MRFVFKGSIFLMCYLFPPFLPQFCLIFTNSLLLFSSGSIFLISVLFYSLLFFGVLGKGIHVNSVLLTLPELVYKSFFFI